jgi:hypothetical protein
MKRCRYSSDQVFDSHETEANVSSSSDYCLKTEKKPFPTPLERGKRGGRSSGEQGFFRGAF